MRNSIFEYINPRYLSGISDEPTRIFQPILGYAEQPLVSLEEACKPLLSIVPRLASQARVAKCNSKDPSGGLTQDESAAIRLYTMEWSDESSKEIQSLYVHLNRTLKQIDRGKLRPWFPYLKLLLTALVKLPCVSYRTIWRGIRRNISDDYPPGTEVTWWAFSSCTESLSVLESDLYLGTVGTRTLFSIETLNGRDIRAHSHFTVEDEILLLPGTFFEVKSRLNPAPDLYIVHLQQKIPPQELLEPPFPGAQLFPLTDDAIDQFRRYSLKESESKVPWYRRKIFIIGLVITVFLMLLVVLLATLLGIRRTSGSQFTSTTTVLPDYNLNLTVFPPASVAYAFYPFDSDSSDLYARHDGSVDGRSINFVPGFVATGLAIHFNQSNRTQILVNNSFNFNKQGFTVEAFIHLDYSSAEGSIVQFSSNIALNVRRRRPEFVIYQNTIRASKTRLSLETWYHIAATYDILNDRAELYIDGILIGKLAHIVPSTLDNGNMTLIIGDHFEGSIDQLAISPMPKSKQQILWDATVAVYYPLDGHDNAWLLDYGPNVVNASSASVQPVSGKIRGAINFTTYGSLFQTPPLTPFTISNQSISIAFWIQLSQPSGVIMTVANGLDCLLMIGVRHVDQRLIVYLPNATVNGSNVILVGSKMMLNAWTHVAFTWSEDYQAQLYKDSLLDGRNPNVVQLSRPMSESLMYASIGLYRGRRECVGVEVLNTTEAFVGAMDELYIFSRELEPDEIQKLSVTTYR